MAGSIRGVIFDVDGVLVYQGRVMEGAIETLETLRQRGLALCFLTNSTLKSRHSCAAKLTARGFTINPEEVITASYAAAVYLASLKPRSCWLMLDGEGREEFAGFILDATHPEYLVVGDNRSAFDFDHLNQALRLLLRGAKLIGMQPELVDGSMGPMELNVGSWVGMLERAARVTAVYVGKPNRFVFDLAMADMALSAREVLMVGDRVGTDVAGARAAGMRSLLLRTGEFDMHDLDGPVEPDFVADSITEITEILDRLITSPRPDPGAGLI